MSNEAALRERLRGYCQHVPPAVANGSWNLAAAFKQAVQAANRVLSKRNVTESELISAINKLHTYWE